MQNECWNTTYHLRAPKAWLNDPNGLICHDGTYHVYFQYNSQWPERSQKAWGHFVSKDLVSWEFLGMPLEPTCHEDAYGCFSGCAVSDPAGGMRIFYTGNTTDPDVATYPHDVRRIISGRLQYQLTCTSADGTRFENKQVILKPSDYPDFVTRHVRDPFVWRERDTWHMLLGARDDYGHGRCLVFVSDDGLSWSYSHSIESEYPFGFMWECPNLVRVDGHEFLAFCPEGLPRTRHKWQNISQAGYVALEQPVLDVRTIDERRFVEWDRGPDFYAPQVFTDEGGRTLLIGWMGGFDENIDAAPEGMDWAHCLTVPRELSLGRHGTIRQMPAEELKKLRGDGMQLAPCAQSQLSCRHLDIEVEEIEGPGEMVFDDDLRLSYDGLALEISYMKPLSARGRTSRTLETGPLRDLRVLIDGSAVEVFANEGEAVCSLRWFFDPTDVMKLETSLRAKSHVHQMRDELSKTLAKAPAPEIEFLGSPVRHKV